MSKIRDPAVAGTFYCADGGVLSVQVDAFMREAEEETRPIRALVVPHAGYVYSGAVAGRAFGRLRGQCEGIKHVVVLGPAHRHAVLGLALPGCDELRTPIGTLRVDVDLQERIADLPQVCIDSAAHQFEHSIEVQLPFIQRLLPRRPVLPLLVGRSTVAEVATVIDTLWDDDVLIVVSTDLSHFLDQVSAQALDRETVTLIEGGEYQVLDGDNACGYLPVSGLLASKTGPKLHCIDQRTSADASGDKSRVVGYASFVAYGDEG